MTTTAPASAYEPAARPPADIPVASRDLRLDVFRGLAMFIILVAHTPGNAWAEWIPARWGFSDATEIFVFCSGIASALAFGRTFARAGWTLGAARVVHRCWQVYWAHVGLFMATLALAVALTQSGLGAGNYWGQLNLWPVIVDEGGWDNASVLLGLMTLRYVPNYFDILPMYLVVLAMLPAVVALARVSVALAAGASALLWLLAQGALLRALGLDALHLALPAEPWSDRTWFFNPFAWQLVFFTGYALAAGWLPAPPVRAPLVAAAAALVALSVLPSQVGLRLLDLDAARLWVAANASWFDKSDLGPLRYAHFLALAYLAWVAAGEGGRRLLARGGGAGAAAWNGAVGLVTRVGRQSLAVFVFSMGLARLSGFVLDVAGRTAPTWALVNGAGFALLVAVAIVAGWFKGQPWRVRRT